MGTGQHLWLPLCFSSHLGDAATSFPCVLRGGAFSLLSWWYDLVLGTGTSVSNCEVLGELLPLPEPQFSYLKTGEKSPTPRVSGGLNESK